MISHPTQFESHPNLVEQYLVFAEGQAIRRVPMTMNDWIAKLHGFLTINDRDILNHAGKVSHDMAKTFAEAQYGQFDAARVEHSDTIDSDFDRVLKQLPAPRRRKPKGKE